MEPFRSLVYRIGDSLFHWTCYLGGVERIEVLRESAIDYAISETLEVNKHANKEAKKSNGRALIDDYEFRHPHPTLFDRSVDLYITINHNPLSELYSEFKYVNRTVSNDDGCECQRYFTDIYRLFAIKKSEGSKARCLFIVVGKSKDFGECFRKNIHPRLTPGLRKSPFSHVLSFNEKKGEKRIKVNSKSIKKYYSEFKKQYKYRPNTTRITDNDYIYTRLVYSKQSINDPLSVCIWEIMD